ncbi:MAG: chloride channel protein [Acidobacteriota bacterium]
MPRTWAFRDAAAGLVRRVTDSLRGRRPTARLVLAALLGSLAGLFSTAFWNSIATVREVLAYYVAGPLDQALPLPWAWAHWRFLFPALGALAATLLARWLFRTPGRLGVASVMLDARREWGRIPLRYVPATFVNGVLTIGSGGSAGREAPVVAMGGGLGAWVARTLGLPPAQRRLLVGCGAAAAIAAAFNAPLAGVFFSLEVVLGDFRLATLAPVMLASVAGTVVCRATEGSAAAAHFQVPPYHLVSGWETLLYAGLGLLAGLIGQLFAGSMKLAERRFEAAPLPPWLRPAVGGLGVGLIGLALPGVLGNGYEWTIGACSGVLSWQLLVFLLVGKIVATALTLGSGGWGGDFAPTLYVGSMVGGAYGVLLHSILGSAVAGYGAYAMVGMGAVLAAVIRCPITAILLLFELTSSYEVILPIMVAVATASFVARRLSRFGLYHQRLREMGGPAFEVRGEDTFGSLTAGSVMRAGVETVTEQTSYREVVRRMLATHQEVFPVVRGDGTMSGAVRLADLRATLLEAEFSSPVVAADLAVEEVPLITAETPVDQVVEALTQADWEELPVVASPEDRRPVGLVAHHDIVRATVRSLA